MMLAWTICLFLPCGSAGTRRPLAVTISKNSIFRRCFKDVAGAFVQQASVPAKSDILLIVRSGRPCRAQGTAIILPKDLHGP